MDDVDVPDSSWDVRDYWKPLAKLAELQNRTKEVRRGNTDEILESDTNFVVQYQGGVDGGGSPFTLTLLIGGVPQEATFQNVTLS